MFDTLAAKLGFVRIAAIEPQLDFARSLGFACDANATNDAQVKGSVAKRLDRLRALADKLAKTSNLFEEQPKYRAHLKLQDDMLVAMYSWVHGRSPNDPMAQNTSKANERVRPRPVIFGG